MAASEHVAPEELRILVVDDNPANVDLLEAYLLRRGYETIAAYNGQEALARAADGSPDVILLDVMLPDLDGYEICRTLKAGHRLSQSFCPIIMVTALGDRESRLAGYEAGADEFLTKPVDETELLVRIRSLSKLRQLVHSLDSAENVIFSFARAVEAKDRYTEDHVERVSFFASELGKALGLSEERVECLRKGAILHDVGKIGVPDTILNKEGPLTPEEWEIMRNHPNVGLRILQGLRSIADVLPIIQSHHERLDGSGYPQGLRGDEIPLVARVMQVVDIYDALTTTRSYRRRLPKEEALRILGEEVEKGWREREIVKTFAEILPRLEEEVRSLSRGD